MNRILNYVIPSQQLTQVLLGMLTAAVLFLAIMIRRDAAAVEYSNLLKDREFFRDQQRLQQMPKVVGYCILDGEGKCVPVSFLLSGRDSATLY